MQKAIASGWNTNANIDADRECVHHKFDQILNKSRESPNLSAIHKGLVLQWIFFTTLELLVAYIKPTT